MSMSLVGQPQVVGDQGPPGADRASTGGRMGRDRSGLGIEPRQKPVSARSGGFARARRESREGPGRPGPPGESITGADGTAQVAFAHQGAPGTVDGYEGDDVEGTETRVDTLVPTEIDQLDCSPGHAPDGLFEVASGQGENGAVMIGIAVHVQDDGPPGSGNGADDHLVATLTDIDHTAQVGPAARLGGAPATARHRITSGPKATGTGDEPEDPSPLPLRRTAPHAVVDSVGEGVLETRGLGRALVTDASGHLNADPVTRKEDRRIQLPAPTPSHPVGVHRTSYTRPG